MLLCRPTPCQRISPGYSDIINRFLQIFDHFPPPPPLHPSQWGCTILYHFDGRPQYHSATGPMCFVFCRLYSFFLQPYGSVLFLPVISLLLTNTVSLAYPCDWRGFVGPKKKTSVGLLVLNPLCHSDTTRTDGLNYIYCKNVHITLANHSTL
jgi:hypothetical protein